MPDVKKVFVWGVRVLNAEGEWQQDKWDFFNAKNQALIAARERKEPLITKFLLSEPTEESVQDDNS